MSPPSACARRHEAARELDVAEIGSAASQRREGTGEGEAGLTGVEDEGAQPVIDGSHDHEEIRAPRARR